MLLEYRHVHSTLGLTRMPGEVVRFSATFRSFLHAPPMLALWPTASVPSQEDYLFPGITAIVVTTLGLLAAMRRRRAVADVEQPDSGGHRALQFYAIATVVMWACAFGPGQESNDPTAWLRPYRWLTMLPGYEGLRVPARFAMLGTLCISISAGLAVARIAALGRRASQTIATLCLVGLALDGWMRPVPLAIPPPRAILPRRPRPRCSSSRPTTHARTSRRCIVQWITDGRSSTATPATFRRTTPSCRSRYVAGTLLRSAISPAAGRSSIIVNDQFDAGGDFKSMVEGLPSIERIGTTSAGTLFRLPAQPRDADTITGATLPSPLRDAGGQRLEIDLGTMLVVRGIGFNLRWHYPELGERLLIERSDDGQVWQEAWRGWTGALAVRAAIEEPLIAPVRVPLRDIRTRYLRIYPAPKWLAREIAVIGP